MLSKSLAGFAGVSAIFAVSKKIPAEFLRGAAPASPAAATALVAAIVGVAMSVALVSPGFGNANLAKNKGLLMPVNSNRSGDGPTDDK